ncbi:hypothetical protein G6F48_006129 [Rhizopus delemar]|nr:hypothetical protein G6F48_006129 [Rhizopus delemar]
MVATHDTLDGSVSHSNTRSKQKSSSRRPSHHRAGLTTHGRNQQQKRRSRSVCSSAQQPPPDHRRPSAPAAASNTPRLSIADRFMSPNYSNDSTSVQQNSISPTMTSLELQNSTSTDFPTNASSTGRLSVAERFMHSITSDSSLSTYNQQYRDRSMSSFSGKTLQTTTMSQETGRLIIAETFMKVPNLEKQSAFTYEGTAHPLDINQSAPFDDTSIDTYLHPLSDLNFAIDTGRIKRPWGSQDTLIYQQQQSEQKKKPIYVQFTAYSSDAPSISSRDCLAIPEHNRNARRSILLSDDISAKYNNQGSSDCADLEIGYEKPNDKHCYTEEGQYVEDEDEKEDESEEEKKENDEKNKDLKKSNTQPKKTTSMVLQYNEEIVDPPGIWLGCCFISCRQRPNQRLGQKQKQYQHKDYNKSASRNRSCGRRGWVICIFLCLIAFILVIYFVWPRTPLMRIEGASLTSPAKISETTQGVMVGNVAFESDWLVNITVDNRQNHVPTRLTQIQVVAKDALTGLIIGKDIHNDSPNPESIIISPNAITTIQVPIHVDYQARDSTDTTFLDLIKACSPKHALNMNGALLPAGQHEALPLHFWITLHFFGLDWLGYKPTVIATPATGGFVCPQ